MAPKLINIMKLGLLVLLATEEAALAVAHKEETAAIYVPIDIKYLPLQVSHEFNSIDTLKTALKAHKVHQLSPSVASDKPIEDLEVVSLRASNEHNLVSPRYRRSFPSSLSPPMGKSHRITKRQTRRFPFYRPVIRFSGFSSSRRRVGGFSRRPGMVGYLNDRDYFPTVA